MWIRIRTVAMAAVAWPVAHVLVFLVRFRQTPPLFDLIYFVPTGVLGAAIVLVLVSRARSTMHRGAITLGALIATPFALLGNISGGLLGPLGITAYGLAPIAVGSGLGWVVGRWFKPRR